MSEDDKNVNDLNGWNASPGHGDGDLSDDQVNAAFADLEKQFADDFGKELDDNLTDTYGNSAPASSAFSAASSSSSESSVDDNFSIDPNFDDELAGIIGDKAKMAMLITQVRDPQFLAALCKLMDIDALCVGFPTGSCAILHNKDGQAPEEGARELSDVVAGMSVVSCVNRADKITATHWLNGTVVENMTPPLLFTTIDSTIEDLMIGLQNVDDLSVAGYEQVESNTFSTTEEVTKFIRTFMTSYMDGDED